MKYKFESYTLDVERRELHCDEIIRPVEPQVFDLLHFLIKHRDRVVSRESIFEAVWRGRKVSDAVLGTRINAARQAIGDSGDEQRLIRTLPTKGFRFIGAVREEEVQNLNASAFDNTAPKHKLAWSVNGTPIVAVGPLLNMTGNVSRQHRIDGLTEEIIIELAKIGWLSVKILPAPFADRPIAAKQLVSKSGYLLQGTLRETSNGLRLNVLLGETFTGYQIWAQHYEDIDVSIVQNDIARRLASTVANQVYGAECGRAGLASPRSLTPWQYIIRALRLISTRKRADIDAAEKLLGQAISAHPRSAAVYSLLSFISTLRVHLGWHSRTKMLVALRTAEKALALNPDEPWGYVAIGYALTHTRPDEAIEPLEEGLKLDPNLAMAHYLIALASVFTGNSEIAFRHADMAECLSARSLLARGNIAAHDNVRATACIIAERYPEGIEFSRKVIAQSPRQTPALRSLIVNAACAGEREEARLAFKTLQQFAPTTQEWLDECSMVWRRREHYQKYLEAFRIARLG